MDFSSLLRQKATYWAPGGNDGFGLMSFSSAIEVRCRWENRSVLFRDTQGRELHSTAVVFTDTKLKVGGYLLLGPVVPISGSPQTPYSPRDYGALEIRSFSEAPSLDLSQVLYENMVV